MSTIPAPTPADEILGLIRHYDFHYTDWAHDPATAEDVARLAAQGCTPEDYTHAYDRWSGSTDPHDAWPVIREHMPDCAERRRRREAARNGR